MTCVLDAVNSGRMVITALATLVAGLLPAATTGQELVLTVGSFGLVGLVIHVERHLLDRLRQLTFLG